MEISRAKAALRALAKARRAALDPELRRVASDRLAARGLSFLGDQSPHEGAIVAGYMPIGDEISPLPLMAALARQGFQLALPVIRGKTEPLDFRAYRQGDVLDAGVWGIREPQPGAPLTVPDILLLPLLAFDARGTRLGYGAGYYDRTVRTLRRLGSPIVIGLAYDEQKVDAVPWTGYDEPLDWIVTPTAPIRVQK